MSKEKHYIVFRYMSFGEAIALLKGEKLHNDIVWNVATGRSNDSVGFCFMDGDRADAEYAFQFLSGIVSEDICLILRFNNHSGVTLREASCTYADPYGSFYDTIKESEVSLVDYDISIMTPIRYGFVDRSGIDDTFEWHDMLGEREDIIRMLEEMQREKREKERRKEEERERKQAELKRLHEAEVERFSRFWERLRDATKRGIIGSGTQMEMFSNEFGSLQRFLTIEFIVEGLREPVSIRVGAQTYEDLRREFYRELDSYVGKGYGAEEIVETFNKLYNEEEVH